MIETKKRAPFKGLKFTNPQDSLTVEGWPAAGERTTARFRIVSAGGLLECCEKTTTGKARRSPWGERVRIAEGSDGRHWIIGRQRDGWRFIMPPRMRSIHWIRPNDKSRLAQAVEAVL